MKITLIMKSISVFLGLTFFLACQPNTSTVETQPEPEEDTRLLVQEAYRKIDTMNLPPAFNVERANILRARFNKETDPGKRINLGLEYALELLKAGKTEESLSVYNAAINFIAQNNLKMDSLTKRNLYSLVGIAFMRHGEIENCVHNHSHESCFIPIKGGGIHQLPYGSTNAIVQYEKMLKEFPHDLETRYLLNLAYMTLGQYPDKVPAQYRIDPSWFTSKVKIQPFKDVAPALGINRNSLAGGTIVDDFTNDGWLDIVATSWSPKEELVFYKNNGDGSFSDQTEAFGLKGHVGVLHLNAADYNNDGWLDIHLMRGAWYIEESDIPNTLLMNKGNGSFEDVTVKAGVLRYAPTQASAWGDFNLDGWVDLVVAYESLPERPRGIDLFINQKDGTFKNEATAYGLVKNQFFKGCVTTDVNNDGYPDIYFSALNNDNSLYINQGATGQNGFTLFDKKTLAAPHKSFPCWSFDFDNDGNEDIFVSAYNNEGTPAENWMLSHMGKADPAYLPKLYHNKGNLVFEETGRVMGLNEVAFTMGCNFGDINTDGFLDFYLATGNPLYQSLVPNKMYLNMDGKKFEDVSYSGGFANIQKGHGIGFGDLDHDGDEDIYAVIGGAFDGDNFYNTLFENPNENNNHWVVLKLRGTNANKSAIGARVCVSVTEDGKERKIFRTVTSGASFGGNSLDLEVGLRKAQKINNISVQWPCKGCREQVFTGFEMNKAYALTQDNPTPEQLDYMAVKFKPAQGKTSHEHH